MQYIIRKATIEDAKGKGYVHYKSWMETYTGIMDQSYLDTRSLDRCVVLAKRHPENTYIAEINNKLVGFACYLESRDDDLVDTGEVMAIYVLKEYFNMGIGKSLMDACLMELNQYSKVSVWVLKENVHAINFYKHIGFELDGHEKHIQISEEAVLNEVRMIITTNREVL